MIAHVPQVQLQQLQQPSASPRTACARYVQPLTPAARRTDAALIRAATKTPTQPANVHLAVATAGWRLVWATPDGNEEGVWFLRRTPRGYRTVDNWGGSFSDDSDRAGGVKWAAGRGVPLPLARCFASIGVDHELMR